MPCTLPRRRQKFSNSRQRDATRREDRLRAKQAQQPSSPPFVGDRRTGCACAYEFRQQTPQQRRRPAGAAPDHAGVYDADTFEAASGARFRRPACHKLFTGNANEGPPSPPPYLARTLKEQFFYVIDAARRAFWAFMTFLFPKINPSVGISFWQWRPGNS